MAQTRKKRRRKHSGTQAGTIQRRPAERKPQSKEECRELARQRRLERLERPPTLRGTVGRAAIAAIVFALVVWLVLQRPPLSAVVFAALMFVVYIPMGYLIDLLLYRRHQRKKAGGAGTRAGARDSGDHPKRSRRTRGEG